MSKIEQLIKEIEDYIDSCPFQTLSANKARIIVNKEELGELLVELRLRIPDEIKKYQKIISNQEAILSDAKKQHRICWMRQLPEEEQRYVKPGRDEVQSDDGRCRCTEQGTCG